MHLTVEIPDNVAAALKARADALGVSTDTFVSSVLEKTLRPDAARESAQEPFETGFGMWAQYGPAPSADEIDENRREMLRNFANDR